MSSSTETARCFHCQESISFSGEVIGRGESCPKCGNDVRVCYNCRHYDSSCYNECRESQAERVVDKEKANFCSYFALGSSLLAKKSSSADVLKKLDDLFKKP